MPNTSVYTGADGSLSLSFPPGPEGEAANAVVERYQLLTVGRVQDVTVQVDSILRPFHEIGQRYATELRAGNVEIRGTIGRAYLNGAMLSLLLGEAAGGRPTGSWLQPAFNMTLLASNPAIDGVNSAVTLHEVKLDTWSLHLPEDDFVLESVGFQALFVTVEDEG